MQRLHFLEPLLDLGRSARGPRSAFSAFAILVALAPRAYADPKDAEARAHYDQGNLLYQRGDYKGALSELSEARALTHSYTILRNIGDVRAALNDFLGAIESYRQYLGEGGARLSRDERSEAQAKLTDFEAHLAAPTVVSDVPFTSVFVDSVRAGQTPLTLRLNPGDHDVNASAKDHPEQQRHLTLGAGTRERITFMFKSSAPAPNLPTPDENGAKEAQPVAPPQPNPQPVNNTPPTQLPPHLREVPRTTDTGRVIAWAAVGTLAAGATVTGIWALFANHSLSELREGAPPRDHSAMESEASKTRVLATLTDGLLVGAIGLGAWLALDRNAFSTSAKTTGSSGTLKLRAGANAVTLSAQF